MGFSQYTCFPASRAAIVTGMCRLLCRQTSTASTSSRARSARKSVSTARNACARGDALQLPAVGVGQRHDARSGNLLVSGDVGLADLPDPDDADANLVPCHEPTLPGGRGGLQSAGDGAMLGHDRKRTRALDDARWVDGSPAEPDDHDDESGGRDPGPVQDLRHGRGGPCARPGRGQPGLWHRPRLGHLRSGRGGSRPRCTGDLPRRRAARHR